MAKKFRVISQAEAVAGKTKQDVHKALLKMNMKPEQIQLLLLKPLVIKKGLDNATALEYAERFSAAGLKVRIEVYEVADPAPVTTEEQQREQIYTLLLKTFTNPVQPATLAERGKLNSVRAYLGALPAPLAYGGLLVGWTFALLWYLAAGQQLIFGGLQFPDGLRTLVWLLTWLIPALIGATVLLFLLYPLWPRHKPEPRPRLNTKRHGRFHHLINQLTAALDVTAPEVIELIPGASIRVAPARGLRSLSRGDLRLSLGLATVAGCSVQQLAGLLAREFGRYASPASARAAIWTRSINQWFADRSRVPDEWDERFAHRLEAYPGKLTRFWVTFAQVMTRRVRGLLARLTEWNNKATFKILQRLELDADLFQMRVAGSQEFRALALQLHQLLEAERDLHQLNHLAFYQREQLLLDLPAAIAASASASKPMPEIQKNAENQLRQINLRPWEAQAADSVRLEQAQEVRDPGMLNCAQPAHLLFDDFALLCDVATLNEYHRQGISDADQHRVDNSRILTEHSAIISQARVDAIHKGGRAPVNADGSVEWTGQS
jgi:hypothetical protein